MGKVKAPALTNQIIGSGIKAAGTVAEGGSALVRGVRKGLDATGPRQKLEHNLDLLFSRS